MGHREPLALVQGSIQPHPLPSTLVSSSTNCRCCKEVGRWHFFKNPVGHFQVAFLPSLLWDKALCKWSDTMYAFGKEGVSQNQTERAEKPKQPGPTRWSEIWKHRPWVCIYPPCCTNTRKNTRLLLPRTSKAIKTCIQSTLTFKKKSLLHFMKSELISEDVSSVPAQWGLSKGL